MFFLDKSANLSYKLELGHDFVTYMNVQNLIEKINTIFI